LLQASAYAPARSRIVPAAVAMPTAFTRIVNLLAQWQARARHLARRLV
jgi:hypothetical protein